MPQDLPPLAQRALCRLIRAFAPDCIVLFGSYATGATHERSDIDLLVIAPIEARREPHERRARQLVADCFPPMDVVLASTDDVEGADEARSPFLMSIVGSGVTVYERPDTPPMRATRSHGSFAPRRLG
jgi:hypothetical protein